MLTRIERRRCPHDHWFQTTARLNSILRCMTHYDDESATWPKALNEVTVPIWVRMEKYKAQETKRRPDGMTWGPVIKIGTQDSPEIQMFGHHHACGLFYDWRLDGHDASEDGKWLYHPLPGGADWGEDLSVYECSKCGNHLYRDDFGVRHDLSACLMDGEVVCRACDWHGMIAPSDVRTRMEDCRRLAAYIGKDAQRSLERGFEMFGRKRSGSDLPLQTRVFLDGEWSFFWSTLVHTEEGWKKWMHGGLIMHGPTPTMQNDGTFLFSQWDYAEKKTRTATPTEVARIEWSIHT
jgi:hypothetical protein